MPGTIKPKQLGPTIRSSMRPRRFEHGAAQFGAVGIAAFAKAGGDHDRRFRSARGEFGDERRNRIGWSRDHRQIGRYRQTGHIGISENAFNRIDDAD